MACNDRTSSNVFCNSKLVQHVTLKRPLSTHNIQHHNSLSYFASGIQLCFRPTLYIRSGRSHRDVTLWFVDCRFEASSSKHFEPSPPWFFATLVFLQPEVTREGGAKYNRTLNKTFLGDQNVIINFHELKTHCERVKVLDENTDNSQTGQRRGSDLSITR